MASEAPKYVPALKRHVLASFEFYTVRPDIRLAFADVVDEDGLAQTQCLILLKVVGAVITEGPKEFERLVEFAVESDATPSKESQT